MQHEVEKPHGLSRRVTRREMWAAAGPGGCPERLTIVGSARRSMESRESLLNFVNGALTMFKTDVEGSQVRGAMLGGDEMTDRASPREGRRGVEPRSRAGRRG